MKTLFTTVLVAFATLTLAASPALACGPYGDPVAMAEMDVEWTTSWVEHARGDLEHALASEDPEALAGAVAEFERAVTAQANADTRLVEVQRAQAEAVAEADVGL